MSLSQRLSQPYLSHWDRLPVELKAKIACMAAFPVGDFEILETVIETRIETGVTETVTETGTKTSTETPWTLTWTEPKYKINVYWSELRYQGKVFDLDTGEEVDPRHGLYSASTRPLVRLDSPSRRTLVSNS